MSRAAWVGLLLIGAALGLVAFLVTRGLPEDVVASMAEAKEELADAVRALDAEMAAIDRDVAADPTYLADTPEVVKAKTTLVLVRDDAVAAATRIEAAAAPLLAKNRYGDTEALLALIAEAKKARTTAIDQGAAARKPVSQLKDFKENFGRYKEMANTSAARMAAVGDVSLLKTLLDMRGADCPEARASIGPRIHHLDESARAARSDSARFAELTAAEPINYAEAGRTAIRFQETVNALKADRDTLDADIESLAHTRDRVLVDMQIDGSTHQHRYRDLVDGVATDSGWVNVTPAFYQQHLEHLGLTLRAKPECVPESEALVNAAPPGYHYMGNPRYGQWATGGTGNVWEFYGKYALMRDLWFAGTYRPVNRTVYDSYRVSASARRPWLGSNREYGSSGSETRKRYSTSTYVRNEAARAASAAKSTSYSGSKYGSGSGTSSSSGRSTYKTSSYRSGSSGSSSSRSGSYRSSSYRSSSRSGGGK